jgi:hypothetical protein
MARTRVQYSLPHDTILVDFLRGSKIECSSDSQALQSLFAIVGHVAQAIK